MWKRPVCGNMACTSEGGGVVFISWLVDQWLQEETLRRLICLNLAVSISLSKFHAPASLSSEVDMGGIRWYAMSLGDNQWIQKAFVEV